MRKSSTRGLATLLIQGRVEGVDLSVVAAAVSAELGCPVGLRSERLDIDDLVDPVLGRADAGQVLARLRSVPRPEHVRHRVAVVDADLHRPGFEFEFGEADLGGPEAVVSMHRLRAELESLPPTPDRLADRLAAEVLHEFGHALGFGHCDRPECVLSISFDVADVDTRGSRLCVGCHAALRRRVRREVDGRSDSTLRLWHYVAAAALLLVLMLPFLSWGEGAARAGPFSFHHSWHVQDLGLGCSDCHTNCGEWTGLPQREVCAECHGGEPSGNPKLARLEAWLAEGGEAPWCRSACRRSVDVPAHNSCIRRGEAACRECHGDRCAIHDDDALQPLSGSCAECHPDGTVRSACSNCHD